MHRRVLDRDIGVQRLTPIARPRARSRNVDALGLRCTIRSDPVEHNIIEFFQTSLWFYNDKPVITALSDRALSTRHGDIGQMDGVERSVRCIASDIHAARVSTGNLKVSNRPVLLIRECERSRVGAPADNRQRADTVGVDGDG